MSRKPFQYDTHELPYFITTCSVPLCTHTANGFALSTAWRAPAVSADTVVLGLGLLAHFQKTNNH